MRYGTGDVGNCSEVSFCATTISIYFLGGVLTKLSQGSVRREWRMELNMSIKKIAKMKDVSIRRAVQGFLTFVTGVCAIFLFSAMSADEMDETLISIVGLIGVVAMLGVFVSEIRFSLEANIERRGEPAMEDQLQIFENCEALLGDGGSAGWKALESTSKEVEMPMKYFPPKKGERSVGTGKGITVVDCSAEEVAAWVMDYCSNERTRISTEEGNPARLELTEKARANEIAVATVKKLPFFVDNREFVVRLVWKSKTNKVLVAFESIKDEVDYGITLKKARGLSRGLWLLEDLPARDGAKQCRVTHVVQLDFGGFSPTWVVDKMIPVALGVLKEAIEEFKKGERETEIEEPVEEVRRWECDELGMR
ncbi:hypothetical protein TL16_g10646 [Triparma laevis f. inornata]|uniref:START domain-containing protein n=1 Tax=Triparma laevis f. inornata TaxID=1714386 RepID=A0A9W7EQ73_9STRA|nr:hypothetical protein TL16_g10646 [Triparma laevis f. inornata]